LGVSVEPGGEHKKSRQAEGGDRPKSGLGANQICHDLTFSVFAPANNQNSYDGMMMEEVTPCANRDATVLRQAGEDYIVSAEIRA
jgi:hypothetical protein